ncbi:MAG: transporter ATP-binding protein [Arthrobacter sp.]|nr:transporter ATP-binding protein [Arthrobacter sp.]
MELGQFGQGRAAVGRLGDVVDEPTAALDQARSAAIVRLLRQVTDEFGVATVMVTHDTGLVALTDTVGGMLDRKFSALRRVSPSRG